MELIVGHIRKHSESNQIKREQLDFVIPSEPKILCLVTGRTGISDFNLDTEGQRDICTSRAASLQLKTRPGVQQCQAQGLIFCH